MELALAMTILLISLLSISATTLRSHNLRRQNRERVVAHNAIRTMSERIHSTSYIAAEEDPETWAATVLAAWGPGGTIGDAFPVTELDAAGGNVTVGTITIVTDETLTDEDLGVEIGMPRDLDGDGAADNTNVSGTAVLLPVIVSLRWQGVSGRTAMDHPFYIMGF